MMIPPHSMRLFEGKNTIMNNKTIDLITLRARRRRIKVQWKHFEPKEATWEMEDQMRITYPYLF